VSVSAFSPICNPINAPWGQKALMAYLGDDQKLWQNYDASELIKQGNNTLPMLVDQGGDDGFLAEQLKPELLFAAAKSVGFPLELRMQDGYDHSYYFIASFIEDHLRFHASHLSA
jgi:S-formylglutathione hydrolase